MTRGTHLRRSALSRLSFAWRDDRAAQLVEFAVALPLLVVFVVGIFDFSGAFTLKQKLTNLSRDAARTAAADPASDLGNSVPVSINDVYSLVKNYLSANDLSDCGLSLPTSGSGLTWTMTGTGTSCPSPGLTVTVNRGYYFPSNVSTQIADPNCQAQTVSSTQAAVVATCVLIQYPYQWRFGEAASLLGRTVILPTTISAIGVALNEN